MAGCRGCPQRPPGANDTGNENFRKVLGSKDDDAASGGNSVIAYTHTTNEHFHSRGRVLPHLADSIVVTAHANAWTYGTPVSLGTPGAEPFDIHWLDVVLNDNDQYQFAIYADGVLADEVSITRSGVQVQSFPLPVQMAPVAAAEVTIAVASSGGSSSANVKVRWHPY